MKNFYRCVRLMFRFPVRLVILLVCALLVGVLWTGTIGVIYPLLEIVFNPKAENPRQWAYQELVDLSVKIADTQVEFTTDQVLYELKDDPTGKAASIETAKQEISKLTNLPKEKLTETTNQLNQLQAGRLSQEETPPKATHPHLLLSRIEADQSLLATLEKAKPFMTYIPEERFTIMIWLVGTLLGCTFLKSFFFVVHRWINESIVGLTVLDLRKDFFRKTLRMDESAFSEQGTSDMISRFTYDLEGISGGLNALTGLATREPLKIFTCLLCAAWICWPLLVFSMLVVPIGGAVIHRLSKLLKNANRRGLEGMAIIYGILHEAFRGIQVVKAFTSERTERARFHYANKDFYKQKMRVVRYDCLTNPVTEMVGIVTISVTLLAGAYLVISHETHLFGIPITSRPMSAATLLTFYGMLAGASTPARKLSGIYSRLQRSAAAADRVYALIDRAPVVQNPEQPKPLPRHSRELAFENVTFSYDGTTPILDNLSFKIRTGETIAIVGPNGCGKSTLLKLINRFIDPQQGSIKIDGVNIRDALIRDVRQQIGLVTQQTMLFRETIMYNLRYGSPNASDEEVIEAAKKAHAHNFIMDRDKGYATIVAERSLSGGQEQRIALGRAILRDPTIFLLDEATSQIDIESEQLIHRTLEEFCHQRTTIMVTHRLSTLSIADRVMVMDAGKIVSMGSHQELMKNCDFYRRLHEVNLKDAA